MSNQPQPSALLRKNTAKRLSVGSATRTSLSLAGRNLLEVASGSATSNKRRSLLSTPASTNKRRQSAGNALIQPNMPNYSSFHPPSSQGSSQVTPQSSQITPSQLPIHQVQTPPVADLRPLRDKSYQSLIQQKIYDYLVIHKFELEMNHAITVKSLKQPTQKDFILMFRFLYNKLDPAYEFHRSVELEIFSLLKNLDYPYLESVNRSQFSAVGGQNWPSFLGVLYWLIKLNDSVQKLDQLGDSSYVSPEDDFDKIFIQYIRDSYNEFINEKDDYSEFYDKLQVDFNELNSKVLSEMSELQVENDSLKEQFGVLEMQLQDLRLAEKKSQALEDDLIKFKAYIETMETRREKWAEILDKIKLEIKNKELELAEITSESSSLERKISSGGTTVAEINSLNTTRDSLSKAIDTQTNLLDELEKRLADKQSDLITNHQSLENFIKTYNTMIWKFPNYSYAFEIKLHENLTKQSKSLDATQIINKSLKDEKIELLRFRNDVNTKMHKYEDEQIKLSEACEQVSEKVQEQSEQVDSLSSKLTANKGNYEEIYETMINDSTTYSTQIEKLERDLRSIKINTNQGFIELENQYQNSVIEHDEVSHSLVKARQDMYERCQKMGEYIMKFKTGIQTNLIDLADLAILEHENAIEDEA